MLGVTATWAVAAVASISQNVVPAPTTRSARSAAPTPRS